MKMSFPGDYSYGRAKSILVKRGSLKHMTTGQKRNGFIKICHTLEAGHSF